MQRLRPVLVSLATAAAFLLAMAPAAQAAGNGTLTISATVLTKGNCRFSTPTAMALNFGNINPSTTGPKVVTASKTFDCNGNGNAPIIYSVTANNGLYHSGTTRQMRHTTLTTEFLAYTLSWTPTSGSVAKNTLQTLTVTGTIDQSAYQNANVGAYSDTVTITLSP